MDIEPKNFCTFWREHVLHRLSKSNIAILSFIVHFLLVVVAGSFAFFPSKEPQSDFEASGGLMASPEVLVSAPPSAPAAPTAPKFDARPASPTLSANSALSSIVSNAPTTFSMPKVDVTAPTTGMMTMIQSASKSVSAASTSFAEAAPLGGQGSGFQSAFGSLSKSKNNLFSGTFYDLKQTNTKKPVQMDEVKFRNLILEFSREWNLKVLEPFYQSKRTLSTPQIFIPEIDADAAPKAFGVEQDVDPRLWAVVYKGGFAAPESGQFRFVGRADDLILVRLNNLPVLDGSLHALTSTERAELADTIAGPWFPLEKGKNYRLDVLVAEVPGGVFTAWMNIEKKNGKYAQRPGGKGNMLPVFQLSPIPLPAYTPEAGTFAKIPTMAKEGMIFPAFQGL